MPAIRTNTIAILAIGLLAGSTVGVAAQDEEVEATATNGVEAPAEASEPAISDDVRVIELEAAKFPPSDDQPFPIIVFARDGLIVEDITVTPGETVVFRIDNTTGYRHNFYIDFDEVLSERDATSETGIPDWVSGVQEVEWNVPDDITDLKYGCTIPGHYATMQGVLSLSREALRPAVATSATSVASHRAG